MAMTITAPSKRLNVPAPGRTLLVEAERWGKPVRDSVGLMMERLDSIGFAKVCDPWELDLPRDTGSDESQASSELRVAWFLINAWLLSRRARATSGGVDLVAGLQWFFGPMPHDQAPSQMGDAILAPLENLDVDSTDFLDLLPYLLDADGLATRRAVLRDPAIHETRSAKKRNGVVYTPADVVEHMVDWVLDLPNGRDPVVLDPACGTGVYLVAALRALAGAHTRGRLGIVLARLYGIDINALALDSCAFVLLHHAIEDVVHSASPMGTWRAVRMNLSQRDTLSLEPTATRQGSPRQVRAADRRRSVKTRLIEGHRTAGRRVAQGADANSVGSLFPEVPAFNAVVTNPPYAPLGRRGDLDSLASRFECMAQSVAPSTNIYVPFTEFCWRLAAEGDGRAAVVVPLSIAFSQRPAKRALRRGIAQGTGSWTLSFYDRAPDALFGDDVKQRTAILRFDGQSEGEASVHTGTLRRWTSRNRHKLFVDEPRVTVRAEELCRVIPKIGTTLERDAYRVLRDRLGTLETSARAITTCAASTTEERVDEVLVAGTAYNWISAALGSPAVVSGIDVTSQSPLHRFRFGTRHDAELAYSLLSSRIVYWLWRVEGDGFHVPRWFLTQLPISLDSFTRDDALTLSTLGRSLWNTVSTMPVVSRNGGSTTVSFDPARDGTTLDTIDAILRRALGLPAGFDKWLVRYMDEIKVVERPL